MLVLSTEAASQSVPTWNAGLDRRAGPVPGWRLPGQAWAWRKNRRQASSRVWAASGGVRLQLACVGCLNTGEAGGPRCASVAFDTARRAVQPGTMCKCCHVSYVMFLFRE